MTNIKLDHTRYHVVNLIDHKRRNTKRHDTSKLSILFNITNLHMLATHTLA